MRALGRLRGDQTVWEAYAARALENSRRREFDPEVQVDDFVEFVEARMGKARSREGAGPPGLSPTDPGGIR